MGHPLNRHHPKRFKSPTWSFGMHAPPPKDDAETRSDKERKIAAFAATKGVLRIEDGKARRVRK